MAKKETKKTVKKPTTKKSVKKKNPEDMSSFKELLHSHLYLYQYCNSINKKVHEMELEINTTYHQLGFLRQENMEIKSLIQSLAMQLRGSRDDLGSIPKERPEGGSSKLPKKRMLPLHDDVMDTCEACNHVHHINLGKCPRCNFKKKK